MYIHYVYIYIYTYYVYIHYVSIYYVYIHYVYILCVHTLYICIMCTYSMYVYINIMCTRSMYVYINTMCTHIMYIYNVYIYICVFIVFIFVCRISVNFPIEVLGVLHWYTLYTGINDQTFIFFQSPSKSHPISQKHHVLYLACGRSPLKAAKSKKASVVCSYHLPKNPQLSSFYKCISPHVVYHPR